MSIAQDAERPQEHSHAERGNDAPAWQLAPEHSGEQIRLERLLEGAAGRFALILAGYNQPAYRDSLIGQLRSSRTPAGPCLLDAGSLDGLLQLEDWLESHGTDGAPLHLIGLERWLAHDGQNPAGLERLRGFNRHRDHIAKLCNRPLLLWLLQHQLGEFARVAPDAWEWRAGVLDFSLQQRPAGLEMPQRLDQFGADRQQRLARIAELEQFLREYDGRLDDRERLVLWEELGDLNQTIGEWNAALAAYAQANSACRRLDDHLDAAHLLAKTAQIHWQRGEPDTALAELRRAQTVFEALGEERSRAVTLGYIADILQARGDLDEAMRIRREEEIPVYERLGDLRARAVTLGKIADILQASGDLGEATRIRREEEIPVFERLGDMRSRAVTLGKIAEILQARGDLDEAMRIRREEQLPVYERLGDVRARAVTLGKIAHILQARGELDEAIRIRREEEIPIFGRLGDVRELLVTRTNLAQLLLQQSPPDTKEAERLLRLALAEARRLRLPEAGQIEAIMQRNGFPIPAPD